MDIDKLKRIVEDMILPHLGKLPATIRDSCRTKIRYATTEQELVAAFDYANDLGEETIFWDEVINFYEKEKKDKLKEKSKILTYKLGQAEIFAKQLPFFYDRTGSWWLWDEDDRCYKRTDEVDILNMISDSTSQDTIDSKERTEILNALKQQGRKNIPEEAPKSWVQFLNGVIDLDKENLELTEPSPEYFMTNPIKWSIGKNEDTPTIDKLFEDWVGKENARLLYEIIAYCMYRDYPIHRIFCLIGAGLNGKTTFLRLLILFLGKNNVASTELDTLLDSRFEIARLHKKQAVIMGETNFNEISKTSILKKLVGGDLINFEYKNKTPFEDYNYAKVIIATNNLPTTTDKTIGFYRRWAIVDFLNVFDESKDVLLSIPYVEFESLALKCIKILKEILQKRTFTNEGTIEQRRKRYEDRSDPLEKFYKENVEEAFDKFIWKSDFERKLNAWCRENRFREISERTIAHKMKELGISEGREEIWWGNENPKPRPRTWDGIRWKEGSVQDVQDVQAFPTQFIHDEKGGNWVEKLDKSDKIEEIKFNDETKVVKGN